VTFLPSTRTGKKLATLNRRQLIKLSGRYMEGFTATP
jgi:hypothetical protein